MIPIEYDVISEITKDEEDFTEKMTAQQPKCYYVMDNGCVEGQQAMFERPDYHMQHHLKPLFIQAKIDDVGINNWRCCNSKPIATLSLEKDWLTRN